MLHAQACLCERMLMCTHVHVPDNIVHHCRAIHAQLTTSRGRGISRYFFRTKRPQTARGDLPVSV